MNGSSGARITSLDGLRGAAAVSVVLSHLHGALFPHHIAADATPLRIFWAGGEAVILFFVLSGFVLSAPFCRSDGFQFGRFLTARVIRIYIPYFAAVALCVVIPKFIRPMPLDWGLIASHVGLVGNFDTNAYDKVIWSLVHEMRFALVFPVYLWMLRTQTWKLCLAAGGAMSLAAALAMVAGFGTSAGFRNGYLYTAHYLLFFMLGGLLAKHVQPISIRVARLSKSRTRLVLAIGLGLYAFGTVVFHSFPAAMHWPRIAQLGDFVADWAVGFGSFIVMALAIHPGDGAGILRSKACLFAGKVSYSLYLIHVPALSATLYVCAEWPAPLAVAIAVPVICLSTLAFHHYVEAPSHRIGRMMTRKAAAATPRGTAIMAKDFDA